MGRQTHVEQKNERAQGSIIVFPFSIANLTFTHNISQTNEGLFLRVLLYFAPIVPCILNPFTPRLSHGEMICHSNLLICRQNPIVLPFK